MYSGYKCCKNDHILVTLVEHFQLTTGAMTTTNSNLFHLAYTFPIIQYNPNKIKMKTTLRHLSLIILIIVFSLYSCNKGSKYVYPQDVTISDGNGIAKKRNINYIPIEVPIDSKGAVSYDTFHVKLFSKVLFKLGEPILYNYYIGKPVIRLIWIRPSGFPMTLTMEEIDGKVQLKENGFDPLSAADKVKHPKDTIKRIYRAKALNFSQKQKLVDLLKKSKFFEMPVTTNNNGTTGTQLAIEYHDPNNYHLVYRSIMDTTDQSDFRKICDYIIELSNFKTEKRY